MPTQIFVAHGSRVTVDIENTSENLGKAKAIDEFANRRILLRTEKPLGPRSRAA
jgi:hypothetical protein